MSIYLKLPDISGSVTANGFQNQIECESLNQGVGRSIRMTTGRANDRETGHAKFSSFSITKKVDKATPYLFQSICKAQSAATAEINVTKAGSDTSPYLKYTLHNVLISHHSVSVGNGSVPIETLVLDFTKVELSYTPRDSSNQAQAPVTAGYDLETASIM